MVDPLDVRDKLLEKRVKAYEDAKLKRNKWNPSTFGFTNVEAGRRKTEKRKLCLPDKYCVYALVDCQGAFYIGITSDPKIRWVAHKTHAREGKHGKLSDRIFNNLRNSTTMLMLVLEWTSDKSRESVWVKYFEEDLKIPLMNFLLTPRAKEFGHDV